MTEEKTKEDKVSNTVKETGWKKNRPKSHLDAWAESLKDPKIREEWEQLKKERIKKDEGSLPKTV